MKVTFEVDAVGELSDHTALIFAKSNMNLITYITDELEGVIGRNSKGKRSVIQNERTEEVLLKLYELLDSSHGTREVYRRQYK